MISHLLLLCATCSAHIDVVQERVKTLGRVEFAYEGEFERIIDHRTPSKTPARFSFSGRLMIDASQPIVVKEHHHPQRERLAIYKISFTPKSMASSSIFQDAKTPHSQTKSKGGYLATTSDWPHSISCWFPTASLLLAGDDDKLKFTITGEEDRDGRRCLAMVYRSVRTELKYWVDLERNGIVVAAETWRDNMHMQTVRSVDVTLHQGKRRSLWLPRTVLTEGYAIRNAKNDAWESTASPSIRWTTRFVADTLKIDDEAAKVEPVKFSRNAPVLDQTAAAPPAPPALPVSANAPPRPKQQPVTVKDVEQTVTEADVQKAELQATLRTPPADWTQRTAWGLVLVGVVGAGVVGYRRVYGAA